jgi:hypothetical protein
MRSRFLHIAVILATSGAMLGFAASFLVSRRYVARAEITVASRNSFTEASHKAFSKESLVPMIFQSLSYKPRLDFTSMDDLIRQIRENCIITTSLDSGSATLEFTDDDRYAALEIGRALLMRMTDKAAGTQVSNPLQLTETGPTRALFTGAGVAAGLVLTALVWLGLRRQTVSR